MRFACVPLTGIRLAQRPGYGAVKNFMRNQMAGRIELPYGSESRRQRAEKPHEALPERRARGLEELVRRISPMLLRYFGGSSASRSDAEDLLQNCWMQIHRSRRTYRSSEPLIPWIFAIARHTRLDGYRKRRRLESRELLVSEIPENLHGSAPDSGKDRPNAEPSSRGG